MEPQPTMGYHAALRSPIVRRLWGASLASTLGDYVGLGALFFLAHDRTGMTIGAAAVLAVGVIPSLLTGLIGGAWLDRFPRAPALALLQVAGAVAICLPVIIGGIPVVFVTAVLLAIVRIATIAVRSGALAEGVEDDHRGPTIALMGTTDQAAQVVGYLTGGALYVLLGANAALLLDAASFMIGAIILFGLPLPEPDERPSRLPVTAGIRTIVRDPVLRLLALLVAVTGTVASLPEVLAPSVAGPGDPWRPIVLAAAPAGQAITMTVLGRLPHIRRPSVQIVHCGALGLALALAALGRTPAAIAAANLLVGAGVAWIVGPQLTFIRLAPKARMAQITGTMIATLAVTEGIGSLGFAALADARGVSAAYRLAAVLILAAAVIGWLVKERTPNALAMDRDELPIRQPSGV